MSCNCKQNQKLILESRIDELPPEIVTEITACPDCSKVLEQTRALCQLLSLKRHEKANVFVERRYLAGIENTIRENEAKPPVQRVLDNVLAWITLPQVKVAAAAAVVLVLGVQAFLLQDIPAISTPPAIATASPGAPTVAPIALVDSNIQPATIQYGTLPGSVPVRLDVPR